MLKPLGCQGCVLESFTTKNGKVIHLGNSFSAVEGTGALGVVIVLEALGHEEAIEGLPIRPHAQAGSKMQQIFRLGGYDRNQFLITNIVRCQPPDNELHGKWFERQAINHCRIHFNKAVRSFNTTYNKTLLGLGNVPLESITGLSGPKQSISHLRGYVFKTEYGYFIPSYHPSYLRRGAPEYTPVLLDDLRKAVAVANGSFTDFDSAPGWKPPQYIEHPGFDDAAQFYYRVKDMGLEYPVGYDIETYTDEDLEEDERELTGPTEIKTIQFSIAKKQGICLPWKPPYRKIAKAIMSMGHLKLGFNNYFFDDPILKANGVSINGANHDLMWCLKTLHPDYERGLQKVASLWGFPFPWKHLYGTQFEWYGCADVDALMWIWYGSNWSQPIKKLMQTAGVWGDDYIKGYTGQLHGMHHIYTKMADRGVPVNDTKRVALAEELQVMMDKDVRELQELTPIEIRNIHPKRGPFSDDCWKGDHEGCLEDGCRCKCHPKKAGKPRKRKEEFVEEVI